MAETKQNLVVIYTQDVDALWAAAVVEVARDPTTTNVADVYEGADSQYGARDLVLADYDLQTEVASEVVVGPTGNVPTSV